MSAHVVVRGRARFETVDAPAGSAVFAPDPAAEPGAAFEVSGWERRALT